MRKLLSFLVILVLILIAVAFTALNLGNLPLDFYFFHLSLPIAVAVVLFMLIGAVLGVIASTGIWFQQARSCRQLRRRLENCEHELGNLRIMPVKDST